MLRGRLRRTSAFHQYGIDSGVKVISVAFPWCEQRGSIVSPGSHQAGLAGCATVLVPHNCTHLSRAVDAAVTLESEVRARSAWWHSWANDGTFIGCASPDTMPRA